MSKWIVDIHGDIEGDYEIIEEYKEPKTGHWIKIPKTQKCCHDCTVITYEYHCSECDRINVSPYKKYCPNCGTRMEGRTEE